MKPNAKHNRVGERSSLSMSRPHLVTLVLVAVCVLFTSGLLWMYQRSAKAVIVQFVCLTDDPRRGPSAVFRVTNCSNHLIICGKKPAQARQTLGWDPVNGNSSSGLGYLQAGESLSFTVPVPAGIGPWRVPVIWQRRDDTRLSIAINRLHGRWEASRGRPQPVDPLFPPGRVSYSPEMVR